MTSLRDGDSGGPGGPPDERARLSRMLRLEEPGFDRPSEEEILAFVRGKASDAARERVLLAIDASPLFGEEVLALRDDLASPGIGTLAPARATTQITRRWFLIAAAAVAASIGIWSILGPRRRWELTAIETPIMVRGTVGAEAIRGADDMPGLVMRLARSTNAEILVVLLDESGRELEQRRVREMSATEATDPKVSYQPSVLLLQDGRRLVVRVFEVDSEGKRGAELARCSFLPLRR